MLKNRAHSKQLANVLVLADSGDRVLKRLSGTGTEVRALAGTALALEGDPNHVCFIIAEGFADVLIGGRRVTTLRRGDSIVEMAIMDGKPGSATVITTSPVRLFAFDRIGFLGVMSEFPPMSRRLFQELNARLRYAEAPVKSEPILLR